MYQELAGQANYFTQRQLINFLHATVQEDPQLSTVLQTNDQARDTAGNRTKLTLDEFAQMLINQAQVHDATHTTRHNTKRSVNLHHILFPYGSSIEENFKSEDDTYQVNFHGINMEDNFGIENPINVIQAYQAPTSNGSCSPNGSASRDIKAFIKANVWQKLSKEAKQADPRSR